MSDTCEFKIRLYGIDCFDVTWMFWWYISFLETNVFSRIKWFLGWFKFPTLGDFEEIEFKLKTFDFMAAFTGQEYNPIRYLIQFYIDLGQPFWMSGATLGITTPDADIFSEIFSMEVYTIFWQWLVDPAITVLEEILFRMKGGIVGAIPDWIREHCFWEWFRSVFGFTPWDLIGDLDWMWVLIIGFKPECIDLKMTLFWKFQQVFLLLIGWIMWIFLMIFRFIFVLIFFIIYWVLVFFKFIFDFFLAIALWLWVNIVFPILQILWPIIEFLFQIVMIIWNFILLIVMIIWNFILSIWCVVLQFLIMIHDFLWAIFWQVFNFLFELLWPIVYWIWTIIAFIPYWIMWAWYYVMALIWRPLDGICIAIFEWIDENILTPVLESIEPAQWQPALGPEFGFAWPIIFYWYIQENLSVFE